MMREDLFDGPPRPLPQPVPRQVAVHPASSEEASTGPGPVRHSEGYAPFVEAVRARGSEPADLARDLRALAAAVHGLGALLDDGRLAEAAATFTGNVLVALHPAASWRVTDEPEVGTGARSVPVRALAARFREDPTLGGRLEELLPGWVADDERHERMTASTDRLMALAEAIDLAEPAPGYVRPPVPAAGYPDGAGGTVEYGERWPEGAPDDAYSRVTHPERFAPLHDARDALVGYLEHAYDVSVTRGTDEEGCPSVELRPAAGASVRLVSTSFPGLRLTAGGVLDEAYPPCGCDACDETAASSIERLEDTLLAVVRGGLVVGESGGYALRTAGGAMGSSADPDAAPPPEPPGVRPAWPRRAR